ncbi:MAG: hypothetical protein ACE14L_11695 [Terriglobales bacterium]
MEIFGPRSPEDSDSSIACAGPTRRAIPYGRAWKIALRTAHLMAISILVGGHAFGVAAGQLSPWLYAAIASGVALAALEAYPAFASVLEGWGLVLLGKLVLLCVVPFAWSQRIPLLLGVVALSSIGSHMPAKLRHYSLLLGKVTKDWPVVPPR